MPRITRRWSSQGVLKKVHSKGAKRKKPPKPVVPVGYGGWRSEVMLCINALVAAGVESQCLDLIDASIPYELGWNPVRTARAILKMDEKDHWTLRNREVKRVRSEAEVLAMKRAKQAIREMEDAKYNKLINHIARGGR